MNKILKIFLTLVLALSMMLEIMPANVVRAEDNASGENTTDVADPVTGDENSAGDTDTPAATDGAPAEGGTPTGPVEGAALPTNEEGSGEDEDEVLTEPENIVLEDNYNNELHVVVSFAPDTFETDVLLVLSAPGEAEEAALREAYGDNFKAVDISFADAEGNKYQPLEGKSVSVKLTAIQMKETEEYHAVHVDSEGDITLMTSDEPNTTNETVVTETRDVYGEVPVYETKEEKVWVEAVMGSRVVEETEDVFVPDKMGTRQVEKTREVEVPAVYEEQLVQKTRTVEKTRRVKAPVVWYNPLTWFGLVYKNETYYETEVYYEKELVLVSEAYMTTETYYEEEEYVIEPAHYETHVTGYHNEEYVITDGHWETKNTKVPTGETENVVVGTENVDVVYQDVEMSFDATGFSVYAIVPVGEIDPEARVTVNFYHGTEKVATVYVKNRDTAAQIEDIVYDPGVGGTLPSGQLFKGWSLDDLKKNDNTYYENTETYVGADYTVDTTPKTIPQIRTFLEGLEIHEGDILNVYAMIFGVYNISYQDKNGIVLTSEDALYPIDANPKVASYKISQTYTNINSTENFEGWNVLSGTVSNAELNEVPVNPPYKQGTTMNVTSNVVFSTEVSTGHWLVFEENQYGATYNAPVFVKSGDLASDYKPSLAEAANMTCPGYTFVNWYKLKDGKSIENVEKDGDYYVIDDANFEVFDFEQELSDKLIIYAKWTVATSTKYTVIVWKQSVADDKDAADADKKYDYAFSTEVTNVNSLTAITALNLSAYQNKDGQTITVDGTDYNFFGFKYNTTKGVVAKYAVKHNDVDSVAPNGTTIINIYYDREIVTYNYRIYRDAHYEYVETTRTGTAYYYIPNGNSYTEVPLYENNGRYYRNRSGNWWSGYTYSNEYTGTRYDRITVAAGWSIEMTQTGLYGQKLSKYNYEWPARYNGSAYRWYNSYSGNSVSGTFTSIKDMFERSNNENPTDVFVSNFYGRSLTANAYVYHFLQQPDGTYKSEQGDADFAVPTQLNNGMVFRTFQGFTASEFRVKLPDGITTYQTGTSYNGDNLVNPVTHTASNGWTDWLPEGTSVEYNGNEWHDIEHTGATAGGIEYRYSRNKYELTYMVGRFVNRNNEALTPPITGELKLVGDIAYDSSMAPYAKSGNQYFNPDEVENPGKQTGFVFAGWFIDETCTTEALFDGNMPMDGMTVYGKWQQIEYRVFLKPNALINGVRDNTLYWGTSNQAMNFRISYNEKVSVPTGTRTGYEFLGWYTDEACSNAYAADTKLTDSTVPATPAYDKNADWTDGMNGETEVAMDPWGLIPDGATPINKDENRPWITRKLVLYAKWSKVLIGASGIGVQYDVTSKGNPNTAPQDTKLYKDNIDAIVQAAPTPIDDSEQFLYWVVQKWDSTQGKYVDLEGSQYRKYPGDTFRVLESIARNEDLGGGTHRYTIQLRAEYGPKEVATPTHIIWYANGGQNLKTIADVDGKITNSDTTLGYLNLQINEKIAIPAVETFERPGFRFIGWARPSEPTGAFDSETNKVVPSAFTPTDNVTLWLQLNEDGLTYTELDENGDPVVIKYDENDNPVAYADSVTEVAADEKSPYQAIYAVWAGDYYIYYTGSAKQYSFDVKTAVNLEDTSHQTQGMLYAGYTTAFGGYAVSDNDKIAATKATDRSIQINTTEFPTATYNPAKAFVSGIKKWFSTMATTKYSTLSGVSGGTVYYVKEVPNTYLTTRIMYVYDTLNNNKLQKIYLLTVVDDKLYEGVKFELTFKGSDDVTVINASLAGSFSLEVAHSDERIVTKPNDFTDVARGLVGYADGGFTVDDDGYIAANTEFTVTPFWITKDGVKIYGTARTFTTGSDGTSETIKEVNN